MLAIPSLSHLLTIFLVCVFFRFRFLRVAAATAVARISHRNSVRLFVRLFVRLSDRHTGGSVKNGASRITNLYRRLPGRL